MRPSPPRSQAHCSSTFESVDTRQRRPETSAAVGDVRMCLDSRHAISEVKGWWFWRNPALTSRRAGAGLIFIRSAQSLVPQ